jgi:PAS domain S-box-containing protein
VSTFSTGTDRAMSWPQASFLSLAETLSSLIAVIQGDKLIYVNPAGCALLGRSKDYFNGRDFWDVVHPDDKDHAIARGRARQAGVPLPKRIVERLVHADGRTIWMDYSIDLIQHEGRPATLVTGVDVTARKRIEEDLQRSEARLAEAQRIGQVGSWEWDVPGNRITWSEELCRIFGIDPSEFGYTLDGYLNIIHPEDRAMAGEVVQRAMERGGPFAFEHRILRGPNDVRTIFGRGMVFIDAAGKPFRLAGTAQDITDRRNVETALRESEQRFRNLCLTAPVMLMTLDPDSRVREVSNYWLQTMGYDRADVVDRNGFDFITPESRERLQQAIDENKRRQQNVLKNLPIRAVRKDGTTLDILSTSVAQLDDAGALKGIICVSINITELKRAEEAILESEERYRALVEHAPDAIMVMDAATGKFVDVNAHAEKLYGYSRDQLLAMGPPDLCREARAGREHTDAQECHDMIDKVLGGESVIFEVIDVDAAGREFPCQVRLSKLPAAGRNLIRVSATDISELKRLQEKIRHTEKLAAVGALAAGVAHEIGNPLMALSMAAQSLDKKICDEYGKMKLGLIREHIDRISRIVHQMNDLARPKSGQRAACDLNHVVRSAVDMVRHDRRSRGTEIEYALAEPLPEVDAVEDELTQVCINLALNAFDAMAENPADRPRRLTIRSAVTGAGVQVSFADTGCGVAKELRPKLFDPFFTTKEAGKGSGLGLSVSTRILQEHQGSLRIEDGGPPGATFVFEIPRGRA